MVSRRKFIHSAALSPLVIGSGALFAEGCAQGQDDTLHAPMVVSTWDFGRQANAAAWDVLQKNGSALDAVEQGVRIPEADPSNQTIGLGGLPDRDGFVTLDASIMDHRYNCGAVMCLPNIVHAISVARLVMEKTPHIFLSGEGAYQFAISNGLVKENLLTPQSEKDWKEWLKTSRYEPEKNIENRRYDKSSDPMPGGPSNHDTIGMLAADAQGNLSGACTTSGLAYKMHGRVGDSPIIGAGLYVDNEAGAATSSGVGEEVIRIVGAHLVVEYMRAGNDPETACKKAVERIIKIDPEKCRSIQVGFLALSKNGKVGAYSIQPGFTYAVRTASVNEVRPAKSHFQ